MQVTYEYNVEKAKRHLKNYNDQFNAEKSEINDRFSICATAIHTHHIFPKNTYPTIADYVENLIALTSAQHLQKAHPNGDTRRIDPDYQYTCLICKTDSIRKDLIDSHNDKTLYTFGDFMFVLDTGFSTDYFEFLPKK